MFDDIQPEYINQNFKDFDFANKIIESKEFDNCTFEKCNFSETAFKKCKFYECKFSQCNLSMLNVQGCLSLILCLKTRKLSALTGQKLHGQN